METSGPAGAGAGSGAGAGGGGAHFFLQPPVIVERASREMGSRAGVVGMPDRVAAHVPRPTRRDREDLLAPIVASGVRNWGRPPMSGRCPKMGSDPIFGKMGS